MARKGMRSVLLVVLALAAWPTGAAAQTPDWCGTPEADASLALDGFPHIPYYAVGCTLEDIEARSRGRMDVRVIGQSAAGRGGTRAVLPSPTSPVRRPRHSSAVRMSSP